MVIWAKIILATVLLGCAVWYLEPAELLAAAGQVGRDKVLICGAIALVGIGVQWMKWQLLLHNQIPEVNGRDALYSLLGGAALGLVTPSRLGELGRGVFLGRSRTKAALLTAVDKLSSAAVTLGLGAAAAWILWPHLRGFFAVVVLHPRRAAVLGLVPLESERAGCMGGHRRVIRLVQHGIHGAIFLFGLRRCGRRLSSRIGGAGSICPENPVALGVFGSRGPRGGRHFGV
jgi:hypothetical protein